MARRAPKRCFWELTAACDHRCVHCRLRAGPALPDELGRQELLGIADQLGALGVRLVVLTGGEPLLSPHWQAVAQRLAQHGVRVRVFTGGSAVTEEVADQLVELGIGDLAVSVDGPAALHDALRPLADGGSSFVGALRGAHRARVRGLRTRAVTTVTATNLHHLPQIYALVRDARFERWQVQLCRPFGRAADNAEQLTPPAHAAEAVVRVLVRAAREGEVFAPLHCSVGYMTEEEPALRRPRSDTRPVWDGPDAGLGTLAIDPRGGVRGCACLPEEFVTASLRTRDLAAIWADDTCFPYTRSWTPEVLAGACAACALARICRAGCPSVAFGATGTIGSNPYCLRTVRQTDQ